MRILLVAPFFPPHRAVASLRTHSFAEAWAAAGHDVTVLTTIKCKDQIGLDLPCNGFRVIELAYRVPRLLERMRTGERSSSRRSHSRLAKRCGQAVPSAALAQGTCWNVRRRSRAGSRRFLDQARRAMGAGERPVGRGRQLVWPAGGDSGRARHQATRRMQNLGDRLPRSVDRSSSLWRVDSVYISGTPNRAKSSGAGRSAGYGFARIGEKTEHEMRQASRGDLQRLRSRPISRTSQPSRRFPRMAGFDSSTPAPSSNAGQDVNPICAAVAAEPAAILVVASDQADVWKAAARRHGLGERLDFRGSVPALGSLATAARCQRVDPARLARSSTRSDDG